MIIRLGLQGRNQIRNLYVVYNSVELVLATVDSIYGDRHRFGGIRVAHRGERDSAYDEAAVAAVMRKPEISLKVALGLGRGRDRVLTCDLTKDYVAINGDYRS